MPRSPLGAAISLAARTPATAHLVLELSFRRQSQNVILLIWHIWNEIAHVLQSPTRNMHLLEHLQALTESNSATVCGVVTIPHPPSALLELESAEHHQSLVAYLQLDSLVLPLYLIEKLANHSIQHWSPPNHRLIAVN